MITCSYSCADCHQYSLMQWRHWSAFASWENRMSILSVAEISSDPLFTFLMLTTLIGGHNIHIRYCNHHRFMLKGFLIASLFFFGTCRGTNWSSIVDFSDLPTSSSNWSSTLPIQMFFMNPFLSSFKLKMLLESWSYMSQISNAWMNAFLSH